MSTYAYLKGLASLIIMVPRFLKLDKNWPRYGLKTEFFMSVHLKNPFLGHISMSKMAQKQNKISIRYWNVFLIIFY